MKVKQFDQLVENIDREINSKDDDSNVRYLLIKGPENEYFHNFDHFNGMCDIRSLSKTIMAIVTGIVMEYSKKGSYDDLSVETKIFPTLKDHVNITNKDNLKYLEKIKLKHLLTHTVGYDEVLMMRDDIQGIDPFTYLDLLLNHPIHYEPGEYYLYSNAGFYLLSAFLQEFIGEDLLNFIQRKLFDPLNFKDFKWERYGDYLAGATRCWIYPQDLLKIGELFFNDGNYKNHKIVSKEWLEEMLKFRVRTERDDWPDLKLRRYAYGYGIWLAKEDGIFFGYGTDGQFLIMLPKEQTIIVTMSENVEIKKIAKVIDHAIKNNNF